MKELMLVTVVLLLPAIVYSPSLREWFSSRKHEPAPGDADYDWYEHGPWYATYNENGYLIVTDGKAVNHPYRETEEEAKRKAASNNRHQWETLQRNARVEAFKGVRL